MIRWDWSKGLNALAAKIAPLFLVEEWRTFKLGKITYHFTGRLRIIMNLQDNLVLPGTAPTSGLDADGQPTPLAGTIAITVDNPAILTLVQPDPGAPNATPPIPAGGPGSFTVQATTTLGTANLVLTDTGDLGVPPLLVSITTTASAPVSIAQPTFGTPRPA